MKKLFAILLALVMMLSMAAMAEAATTGTITITNASQGQDYTVYKIFDAHYNDTTKTTSYTVKAGAVKDVLDTELFVVDSVADSDGNYAVSAKEGVSSEDILDWVKANADKFEKIGETVTATSNTVVFNVPYGYYYITSSLGATVTVDTNTPNVNVIDKNTTSPSEPEDPDNLKTASDDTAEVADTVTYTVSFVATNFVTDANGNTTQVTQYVIEDTPEDLDIDTTSIAIKTVVGNVETPITDATITETDGKVSITIPWATEEGVSIYASPIDVVITYDAVVTEGAADGAANNSVVVKWNTTQFGADEEELKTYMITVNKVDDAGAALVGAEFELYDAATGGNKIILVKEDDFYRPATAKEQADDGFTSAVIEAGTAVIKGLDGDKTYYLEEIKAPEGYNKLTAREAVSFGEENAPKANATSNVVNNAGSELPSTGGIGTTIFYVVGGLMMAAAVVILVAKKKVSAK